MIRILCIGFLAALLLIGCASARRGEPIAGPFVPANDQQARGAAQFDMHCGKCHTGGEAALGPAINDKPLPVFLMKFQMRHGLGAMPGFEDDDLSQQQLDDIAVYLQALRLHGKS